MLCGCRLSVECRLCLGLTVLVLRDLEYVLVSASIYNVEVET
jgi:hypothetical protein